MSLSVISISCRLDQVIINMTPGFFFMNHLIKKNMDMKLLISLDLPYQVMRVKNVDLFSICSLMYILNEKKRKKKKKTLPSAKSFRMIQTKATIIKHQVFELLWPSQKQRVVKDMFRLGLGRQWK